jgi:hypothetical protein
VTSIGNSSFAGNSIYGLVINDNVKTIGPRAFYGIRGDGYITLGHNVQIGSHAFSRDVQLTNEHGHVIEIVPRSYGFPEFYHNNGRKMGTYTYRENRWMYSTEINQRDAKEYFDKKIASVRGDTVKEFHRNRTFLFGLGAEWGSPQPTTIDPRGKKIDFVHFVIELGGYKSLIPYTFIGGEARMGWSQQKGAKKDPDAEGEYLYTSTMHSFAPTAGLMLPITDGAKLNLGALYEFGGSSSKLHKIEYSGALGLEVGIEFLIQADAYTAGRVGLRYRTTFIDDEKNGRMSHTATLYFGI